MDYTNFASKITTVTTMKRALHHAFLLAIGLFVLTTVACRSDKPASEFIHKPLRAIYHWKTTFSPTSGEVDFMKRHGVGRVYLHYFDVVLRDGVVQPEATVRFRQNYQ